MIQRAALNKAIAYFTPLGSEQRKIAKKLRDCSTQRNYNFHLSRFMVHCGFQVRNDIKALKKRAGGKISITLVGIAIADHYGITFRNACDVIGEIYQPQFQNLYEKQIKLLKLEGKTIQTLFTQARKELKKYEDRS